MIDRREFLKGAAAAGLAAGAGCVSAPADAGRGSFYGPTVRDRLWMWGHHVEMAKSAGCCAWDEKVRKNFKFPGRAVDQAEGCRLMGIVNNCVIRWGDMPKYPFGDYFDQFRDMKRIAFDVYQGGDSNDVVREKMRIAFEELQPAMPNLTGVYLDDYFNRAEHEGRTPDLDFLESVADAVHGHGLRLSMVSYFSQLKNFAKYRRHFGMVDEVSFWFWRGESIRQMEDAVRKCRDEVGERSLLLGLYMWDFTTAEPVPADLMTHQLDCAGKFLADGTVDGLLFHPTFVAALDVPSVNISKEWIKANGEKRV